MLKCVCRMQADAEVAAQLAAAKQAVAQSIFKWHRKLGAGPSLSGIDGTLTKLSWMTVIQKMVELFNITSLDRVWDAGCGSGVCVLMLALLLAPPLAECLPRICSFELCPVKTESAESLMQLVMAAGLVHENEHVQQVMAARTEAAKLPTVYHASVSALGPIRASIVVAFWEGWAPADKIRLGQVFAAVRHAIIIQRRCIPQSMLQQYEWPPMQCMLELPVSMHGSGQRFVAYFFRQAG